MLLWLIAGIVIGWLVEFVIDWRFWRRAVFSTEPIDVATLNELASLRRKLKESEIRIYELERQSEIALSNSFILSESTPSEPMTSGNSAPVVGVMSE